MIAAPSRPRPVIAAPSRPRPQATTPPAPPAPVQAAPEVTESATKVQPAKGFEPKPYTLPVQPKGIPGQHEWQNGSAVFAAGYAGRVAAWVIPTEFQEGFLGRLQQDADGYLVYGWSRTTKTYRALGRRKTLAEAFALL